MDFKTILTRFGLDSSNFVNKSIPQIETEHRYIYEVEEIYKTKNVLIVIMKGFILTHIGG